MENVIKAQKATNVGEVQVEVQGTISVTLTTNDIFNWLAHCTDVDDLRYLGKYALRLAETIEHPDNDDFRSRA